MSLILVAEQILNGLQFGVMLFLMAAGLTLVFGIMGLINLAHGTLYMVGAYAAATALAATGSFILAIVAALAAGLSVGLVLEFLILRRLYLRDHLDQVLATFGIILFFNEATKVIWGPQPYYLKAPDALAGTVTLFPGLDYPAYRLLVIFAGLVSALLLYVLIRHSRLGMLVRAGASNGLMLRGLGVDVSRLFMLVFAFGAMLAAFAGAMVGPLQSVEVGMGEGILILTFVVIVIGGIGSIRGALIGSLLVGLVDTLGRAFLPTVFRYFLPPSEADALGATLATMSIYLVMAAVLFWRPRGLFPAPGREG